jgi:heme exporter protein D
VSEFWSMGGYAVYVWGSYAAALAVFAWNLLAPWRERADVLRRMQDATRAERDA